MNPMPYGKETVVILMAYALGCFTAGYYLVRWWTGEDIRYTGSGSSGATNVGRLLGRSGFLLTLLLDLMKGCVAVWVAERVQLKPAAVILTMLAVVAGHIWPAQLRFHGGKGVATGLGALLVLEPEFAFSVVFLFLPLYAVLRSLVLAGMLAFALLPLAAFLLDQPLTRVFGLSALAVLILIAHRRNIPDEISKLSAARRLKQARRGTPDHSA